ncbi:hypothetical protein ABN220_13875 [Proteus cibi]|uniref:hypothetical protein n=1 Tax=Proteus cibi TaxID=2050966 RepID=UPI0032DA34F4
MDLNIKNNTHSMSMIEEAFLNVIDEQVKVNPVNNINEENKINLNFLKKIDSAIEKNIQKINLSTPELTEPKNRNIKIVDELFKNNPLLNDKSFVNESGFNFISTEMISMINLIVLYLKNMIKKYESSRELGNMFMKMQIDIANKIKEAINKKGDLTLSAAITSSVFSMAIHTAGAFTSIKGINKGIKTDQPRNTMTVRGEAISASSDPMSKIVDNAIQNNALRIEGDNKVLEASAQAADKINNNNSDVQRENTEATKIFIRALEAIIQAIQDMNMHFANKMG